ncbi:sulfiredoxin, chloroplastic/mitochondrial isoform X1 [Cucumis melo]|uniref:Sulfiredoxin, chloroplastic/mitochondrial isoform X1 n=1 Tax=Cucumis melo TaxID=3656 RepID=A0ABM3KFJ9_CUCME|nr:sulfiredoxin, chloroplastic/mitochondrial isoform X1 [Cucumis melo]
MMANLFILKFPSFSSSLRTVSASASSNGALPLSAGSGNGSGPMILELPLEKIRRPLMRTRANDPDKVKELMDSIQEIGLQVPFSTVLFEQLVSIKKMVSIWLWLKLLMYLKLMEFIMVSLVVIAMKLINVWGFLQSAAKFVVELKKH